MWCADGSPGTTLPGGGLGNEDQAGLIDGNGRVCVRRVRADRRFLGVSGRSRAGCTGANATWNESNLQAFADSLGSASKVWYTLGNGELENVFYPETDTPDTFGLQYIVTDGSTFTNTETANTSHAISLADPTSLTWQQVNTATNGDYTITKTYIADPSPLGRSWSRPRSTTSAPPAAAVRRLPAAAEQRRHGQHRRHRHHQR